MSKNSAYFKVHPKLAELLGETYRSVELAVKELIDNSYDADSENVKITIPEAMEKDPKIIISDDGLGMTESEIRDEYLNIANSRTSRKGSKSLKKERKVKGRKGIGKFAGLMVADIMTVNSYNNGDELSFSINKAELQKTNYDLEKVPLPITKNKTTRNNGLDVILSNLNPNFSYPTADKLKEILIRDFGREKDFNLYVNDEIICHEDLIGEHIIREIKLENGITATLNYKILDKAIKNSGLAIRVNNKIIGSPVNFLKNSEHVPKRLHNRIYGELICDELEKDLTSDFGAVISNSKVFKQIDTEIKDILKQTLTETYKTDMKLAKARYQKKINSEIAKLPEYKKVYAEKALYKIIDKYYGESEEKVNIIISVMLSALEKDYYWDIISDMHAARDSDIEDFADALSEFGLIEMGIISSQAINRLRFLDELFILINDPNTLEKTIHKALENNTWVLGDNYNVILSDQTLKSSIESISNKKYKGDNALNRPDMLLGRKLNQELVLIEFKRPSFTINRTTESQALEYRDELNPIYNNQLIDIILLGGKVDPKISSQNQRSDVKFCTYTDIIGQARARINWLIHELKIEQSSR